MHKTMCHMCGKEITYKTMTPNHCKTCRLIFRKEYQKEWDKNNKEKTRERQSRYKEKHPERIKLIFKKYETTEKGVARRKKYRSTNKYKLNARRYRRERRARLHNIIHDFTYDEWIDKVNDTRGICSTCGKNVGLDKLTLDHIFPISKAEKGRIYTIDDVQPLCALCNGTKNAKIGVKNGRK